MVSRFRSTPRRRAFGWVLAAIAAGTAFVLPPACASAAVTLGSNLSTAPISGGVGCSTPGPPCTVVQTTGPNVTSPIDGVLVRYRIRKSDTNSIGTVSLRVLRPGASPGTFTGAGTSAPQATAGTPIFTEFQTRLAIRAGDLIALNTTSFITRRTTTGATLKLFDGGLADGSTGTPNLTGTNLEMLMNADVEPDADTDGFGDETQDACPTDSSVQSECPQPPAPLDTAPPDTTITGGPKAKTKKKAATFEFSGTDARAVARFECSLNGAPFTSCTSPNDLKGKKGKNHFEVRATDAAGNVDATPATFDWKVKKKKK